jgi:uncharacterized membrane protein required for colicin V production
MSIFLVLDVLLILLIALFAPIGFWRGPVKELFVTLGILFGVILADYWARPWGSDLTDVTSLNADAGAFVTSMIFLVFATFVIGYGIGAALAAAEMLPETRALGAVIAAFNGTLLLSFSLQYVRLFLLSDSNEESLEDSFVARFLLDEVGWILMAAAVVAVPVILYLLLSGRRAYEPVEAYPYGPADPMSAAIAAAATPRQQPQSLPPRVPAMPRDEPADYYKSEPAQATAQRVEPTRAVHVDEPRVTAEPGRRADPATRMEDTDPHMLIPVVQNEQPQEPPPAAAPAPPADLAPGYARCTKCRAVLAPDTKVCPNCGTPR